MRPLPILLALFMTAGCAKACGKKKEAKPTLPGNPPIQVPEDHEVGGEFKSQVANGVRRFVPPRAEEVTGLSAAPDGSLLAAVTGKNLYLFGRDLKPVATVELPGLPPTGRQVAVLSGEVVAVWNLVPAAQTETRVLRVSKGAGKDGPTWGIKEERLAGEVAFGAVVGGRLVLVVREPATVAVFDDEGKMAAQHEIAANPQRIDVSPDGAWAAIASAGNPGAGFAGVLAVDLSGGDAHAAAFTTVNTGPGVFRPVIALPVGDAVLVAGSAESDRPLAVVAPRAGGDLRARIALGEGTVMGAVLTSSGKRAAVFVNKPKGEKDTEYRAVLLDTTNWSTQGQIAGGPARLASRPVPFGDRVAVADCHSVPILDLAAATLDPGVTFPSPGEGPCLAGLWVVGDRLAAREGRQVVTWPAPR